MFVNLGLYVLFTEAGRATIGLVAKYLWLIESTCLKILMFTDFVSCVS